MSQWISSGNEALQPANAGSEQSESVDARRAASMSDAQVVPFPTRTPVNYPASSVVKRGFDLIAATVLLFALMPVMTIIAILVTLDGGGILFKHKRIGANGKTFACLKFRTMCVDAETRLQKLLNEDPDARAEWERDFKLKNDPRITPWGNFLRKTSLDELPQLLNVLKGDMSLVGPRPIVIAEAARYGAAFRDYLGCRPGLTGLWQVSGRNDVTYENRVKLDSNYARTWSLARDLAILMRTVRVVFGRNGAY